MIEEQILSIVCLYITGVSLFVSSVITLILTKKKLLMAGVGTKITLSSGVIMIMYIVLGLADLVFPSLITTKVIDIKWLNYSWILLAADLILMVWTMLRMKDVSYYVVSNGLPTGPYNLTAISSMVILGKISGQSLVWKPGMDDWATAQSIQDLAVLLSRQHIPPIPFKDQ